VRDAAWEHVVEVLEFGRWAGRHWELIEFCPAGSLRDLIDREGRKLSPTRVEQIVRELAAALAHLHERGCVHRDLKPSNVLVRTDDETLDLVLSDFGLTARLDGTSLMRAGDRSFAYAAPEAAGTKVQPARDWWSLGMMTLEMLTGEHPFAPGGIWIDEQQMVVVLATEEIDVDHVDDLHWQRLCAGLLTRSPTDRWGAAQVARWLDGEDPPVRRSASEPARRAVTPFPLRDPATGRVQDYADPRELARALAADWGQATRVLTEERSRQQLRLFLRTLQPESTELVLDAPDDAETRLIWLLIVLDPEAPATFRGRTLAAESLATLGQRAGSEADHALLRDLQAQQVLRLYAGADRHRALAAIDTTWSELTEAADRLLANSRSPLDEHGQERVRALVRARALTVAAQPEHERRRLHAEAQRARRGAERAPLPYDWLSGFVPHGEVATTAQDLLLVTHARLAQDRRDELARERELERVAHRRANRARFARRLRNEAVLLTVWGGLLLAALVGGAAGLTYTLPHAASNAKALAALAALWPIPIAVAVACWISGALFNATRLGVRNGFWSERGGGPHLLLCAAAGGACVGAAVVASHAHPAYVPPATWRLVGAMIVAAHVVALGIRRLVRRPAALGESDPRRLLAALAAASVVAAAWLLSPVSDTPTRAMRLVADRQLARQVPFHHCTGLPPQPAGAPPTVMSDIVRGELACRGGDLSGRFVWFTSTPQMNLYASARSRGLGIPLDDAHCQDSGSGYSGRWFLGTAPQRKLGTLTCTDSGGGALVEWSDTRTDIYGIVTRPGSRAALYRWWRRYGSTYP
jgi:hypothetical protein